MTRKRTPVNEILSADAVRNGGLGLTEDVPPRALWRAKHTRLQLVRAIQIKGDQFVGVQGVSEIWLYPQHSPDAGHGYVQADDSRGLLIQLCQPGGAPTQHVFIGWSNVAGITERDAK